MITDKYKELMRIHGITYAEIGEVITRSPATVKQRLNTESTFHKHEELYGDALKTCINNKEKQKAKAMEELNDIS